MRVVKIYVCPVCQGRYYSREAAEKCRQKHQIGVIEFCYCETCGEGWNVGHYGMSMAAKIAKECEQQHKMDGNEDEKAAFTYFFTGGWMGKSRCIKSKNMETKQGAQVIKS